MYPPGIIDDRAPVLVGVGKVVLQMGRKGVKRRGRWCGLWWRWWRRTFRMRWRVVVG